MLPGPSTSTALSWATGWPTFMSSWHRGTRALHGSIGGSGSESGPTLPALAKMRCGAWWIVSGHMYPPIEDLCPLPPAQSHNDHSQRYPQGGDERRPVSLRTALLAAPSGLLG